MNKTQIKKQTVSVMNNDAVVLSPDAQAMHDFKTALFIVSIMINVLLLIFWVTYEVVRTQT